MKTIKKLSFLLAFVITLFAASCSDMDVTPRTNVDDDDDPPIVINPPRPNNAVSSDTLNIG